MKPVIGILVGALLFVLASCKGELSPPSCESQVVQCKKNCGDGGGTEDACRTVCEMDEIACKCIQEHKCVAEDCVNSCYEPLKSDYDCDVNHQACLGFCKNQFQGDENCPTDHCESMKIKCECFKAGNCENQNATPGHIPMPSCKFLQGKCLKNCHAGEGEDSECDALCHSDSEICNCIRKNKCDFKAADPGDFQKCVRRCQTSQKDTYNCDVFHKTCLGNCKTSFGEDEKCPNYCTQSFGDCKCLIKGECST